MQYINIELKLKIPPRNLTCGYSIVSTQYFGDCQVLSCSADPAVWDELYGVSASTPSISPRGFFSTAASSAPSLSSFFFFFLHFASSGLFNA